MIMVKPKKLQQCDQPRPQILGCVSISGLVVAAWLEKKRPPALSLQLLFCTRSALTPLEMQLHPFSKTKCDIVFVVDYGGGSANGHGDGHDDG